MRNLYLVTNLTPFAKGGIVKDMPAKDPIDYFCNFRETDDENAI